MPMYPIRRTECIMREESGIPIITSGPLEIRLKSVIIPAVPPDALCPMSLQTQYGGMKVFPAAYLVCLWLRQYTRHSFFSPFTRTGRGREAGSLRAVIRSHKAIRLQRSSRPPPQASRPQSLWPCRLRQALSALQLNDLRLSSQYPVLEPNSSITRWLLHYFYYVSYFLYL